MSQRSTRITTEEVKVTQEFSSDLLPNAPLVTFDLNVKNLQEYLNKVTIMVNKNIMQIQSVSEELHKKLSVSEGLEIIEGISLSIPGELGGKKPKSNNLKEIVSAANIGVQGMCEKLAETLDFKKDTKRKLDKLESSLSTFLTTEKFDSEKKSIISKLKKKVPKDDLNKQISKLEAKIHQIEDTSLKKLAELDKKISESEVNTLWKIRDCENLLKSRVNETFVWDALSTLEQKLKKEKELRVGLKKKDLLSKIELLEKDLKFLISEQASKLSESRTIISELDKQ